MESLRKKNIRQADHEMEFPKKNDEHKIFTDPYNHNWQITSWIQK